MHDARTRTCSGLTRNRSRFCSCSVMWYCHVTFWAVWGLFCLVEGRCCLAPADQVWNDSTTKRASDKNIFGGGRRRSTHAWVWQGWCQKTPLRRPLRRFWELLQPGAFFFGNNVFCTTFWSLSVDVSFNLQEERTMLTYPFLASWTAFVCAGNGGRTIRASKRRPRAAEVTVLSSHVFRV